MSSCMKDDLYGLSPDERNLIDLTADEIKLLADSFGVK